MADNNSEADLLVDAKEEGNLGKRPIPMWKMHRHTQLARTSPEMCNVSIVEETTMLQVAPIGDVNVVVNQGAQAQTEVLAAIEAVILVE